MIMIPSAVDRMLDGQVSQAMIGYRRAGRDIWTSMQLFGRPDADEFDVDSSPEEQASFVANGAARLREQIAARLEIRRREHVKAFHERFKKSAIEIEQGRNLFDLYVDSTLCFEATYQWEKLSSIRRANWIRMAKRIHHGALDHKRGDVGWYKES